MSAISWGGKHNVDSMLINGPANAFLAKKQKPTGMSPIPIPERLFYHVHKDIVGLLPISQDNSHILAMIDRTTC